jgi:hypothetical protein
MADYTISTTAERESALQEEARRTGLTALQTLQFYVNNLLDGKSGEQIRNRADRISTNWEKLSPEEKQTILDALDKAEIPPREDEEVDEPIVVP